MGDTEINRLSANKIESMHTESEKGSVWKALDWLGLHYWIWRGESVKQSYIKDYIKKLSLNFMLQEGNYCALLSSHLKQNA